MREEDDDEEWVPQASFESMADANEFGRRVGQALSSTEHVARWAASAAAADPQAEDDRLATAWIRVQRPTDRLLWALHRLNRIQGRHGDWQILLSSPIFCHPWVMYTWATTAVGMLGRLLGEEGSYVACTVFPPR